MFVTTLNLTAIGTAENFFQALPNTCRLVKAQLCLYTAHTAANSVITFSDGTTTIGAITLAYSGCAEGDVFNMVIDTSSLGKVELGGDTELKIALDGGGSSGTGILTMVFDEFHSNI